MPEPQPETGVLTNAEREALSDDLHRNLGFYIGEDAEAALVERIETFIEVRTAAIRDLADGWQAEVEDDGDGLTHLGKVLDELRAALAYPPGSARAEGHYCLDCGSFQCAHAHATYPPGSQRGGEQS